MAEAKAISTRKKIAAAILALSAGVVGTGFAAGTITLTPGETHGAGQGNIGVGDGLGEIAEGVDITGQLTITGPEYAFGASGIEQTADGVNISGWSNLENAEGAQYKVEARYQYLNSPKTKTFTGTVPTDANAKVNVPSTVDGNYDLGSINVYVIK